MDALLGTHQCADNSSIGQHFADRQLAGPAAAADCCVCAVGHAGGLCYAMCVCVCVYVCVCVCGSVHISVHTCVGQDCITPTKSFSVSLPTAFFLFHIILFFRVVFVFVFFFFPHLTHTLKLITPVTFFPSYLAASLKTALFRISTTSGMPTCASSRFSHRRTGLISCMQQSTHMVDRTLPAFW